LYKSKEGHGLSVMSTKGERDQMNVSDAVAMIHATPASDRSHFAREIWRLRLKDRIRSSKKSGSKPLGSPENH
jgi:hypothetical protein